MDICSLNINIHDCGQANVDLEPDTTQVESGLTDDQWEELAKMIGEIHAFLLGEHTRPPGSVDCRLRMSGGKRGEKDEQHH